LSYLVKSDIMQPCYQRNGYLKIIMIDPKWTLS